MSRLRLSFWIVAIAVVCQVAVDAQLSCRGFCNIEDGRVDPATSELCYCNGACEIYEDCCDGFVEFCKTTAPTTGKPSTNPTAAPGTTQPTSSPSATPSTTPHTSNPTPVPTRAPTSRSPTTAPPSNPPSVFEPFTIYNDRFRLDYQKGDTSRSSTPQGYVFDVADIIDSYSCSDSACDVTTESECAAVCWLNADCMAFSINIHESTFLFTCYLLQDTSPKQDCPSDFSLCLSFSRVMPPSLPPTRAPTGVPTIPPTPCAEQTAICSSLLQSSTCEDEFQSYPVRELCPCSCAFTLSPTSSPIVCRGIPDTDFCESLYQNGNLVCNGIYKSACPISCGQCPALPTASPTTLPPSPTPTAPPSISNPTATPSHPPTSAVPTSSPSAFPTMAPTQPPTHTPSLAPTTLSPTSATPTLSPSVSPTISPTSCPDVPDPAGCASLVPLCSTKNVFDYCPITCFKCPALPTASPTTSAPTSLPSTSPSSSQPSSTPSSTPSQSPASSTPTAVPTAAPVTSAPTRTPTQTPTQSTPTTSPLSSQPSPAPSRAPTRAPTPHPTPSPTATPSRAPSSSIPTKLPTDAPTAQPSKQPSGSVPTAEPSSAPTSQPTGCPKVNDPPLCATVLTNVAQYCANPLWADSCRISCGFCPHVSTALPTQTPTLPPTSLPTSSNPTTTPTITPSFAPTTATPTISPSSSLPSVAPASSSPSMAPTTTNPTVLPSTPSPTASTTLPPTRVPSSAPTTHAPTPAPVMECNGIADPSYCSDFGWGQADCLSNPGIRVACKGLCKNCDGQVGDTTTPPLTNPTIDPSATIGGSRATTTATPSTTTTVYVPTTPASTACLADECDMYEDETYTYDEADPMQCRWDLGGVYQCARANNEGACAQPYTPCREVATGLVDFCAGEVDGVVFFRRDLTCALRTWFTFKAFADPQADVTTTAWCLLLVDAAPSTYPAIAVNASTITLVNTLVVECGADAPVGVSAMVVYLPSFNNVANLDVSSTCVESDGKVSINMAECSQQAHFVSSCVAGYTSEREGDGFECQNKNECQLDRHDCNINARCDDQDGSFTCTCAKGWAGVGVGVDGCTDLPECDSSTDNDCDVFATCKEGQGVDYDCFCNDGWAGNGRSCSDEDECGRNDVCNAQASCVNTNGSFTCGCNVGWVGDGTTCVDVDECDDFRTCSSYGIGRVECVNDDGSFACMCIAGFEKIMDAVTKKERCSDIDDCQGEGKCVENLGICTDLQDAYSCQCRAGYSGDGKIECDDIDECALGLDDCDINAHCNNTQGAFKCTCNHGWEWSVEQQVCVDVNECTLATDDCHGLYGVCDNSLGSFECACNYGFVGNGVTCTDIPECDNPAACNTHAECTEQPGFWSCACNAGWAGNGFACADVQECGFGYNNACHQESRCVEGLGSYTCQCNSGYSGNGTSCANLDECALFGEQACPDVFSTCVDEAGDYACDCNEATSGYKNKVGSKRVCVDVDECEVATRCHPSAMCANDLGSFSCACNAGYVGDGSNTLAGCVNLNECDADPCDGNARCTDFDPPTMFECGCNNGYSGNGTICVDVDECADDMWSDYCDVNGKCTNTDGLYACACNQGYQQLAPGVCGDVNECNFDSDDCDVSASCANIDGSFTCTCNAGWTGSGVSCQDVDECGLGLLTCAINAQCNNVDGTATCACNAGWTGDGASCNTVYECTDPSMNSCHANAVCDETPGSYTCECYFGYAGDGIFCREIDECRENKHECPSFGACVNLNGSYTCTCEAGFVWDFPGKTCRDVNECLKSNVCATNALCANTDGAFQCTCIDGYSGDGYTSCQRITTLAPTPLSLSPTQTPSQAPIITLPPSTSPTVSPTTTPTAMPTTPEPTTLSPTAAPSQRPTRTLPGRTRSPVRSTTRAPSSAPSASTAAPTSAPSRLITKHPTGNGETFGPTVVPSSQPTAMPMTRAPTSNPVTPTPTQSPETSVPTPTPTARPIPDGATRQPSSTQPTNPPSPTPIVNCSAAEANCTQTIATTPTPTTSLTNITTPPTVVTTTSVEEEVNTTTVNTTTVSQQDLFEEGDTLSSSDDNDGTLMSTPAIAGVAGGAFIVLLVAFVAPRFCKKDTTDNDVEDPKEKINRAFILEEMNSDDTPVIRVDEARGTGMQPTMMITSFGGGESSSDGVVPAEQHGMTSHMLFPESIPPRSQTYDQWLHAAPMISMMKQMTKALKQRDDCPAGSFGVFQNGKTNVFYISVLNSDAKVLHHMILEKTGVFYLMIPAPTRENKQNKISKPFSLGSKSMEDVLAEVLQGKHQDIIGTLGVGLTITGEVKTPKQNDKHNLSMFVHKQRWVKGPKHATSILTKVNAKNKRGFFVLLDEGKSLLLCLSTGHSVEYFGIVKTSKGYLIRDMSKKRQVLARADNTNALIHLLAGADKDPQTPPVRLTAGLHRAAVSEDKARWFTVAKPPDSNQVFTIPSPMLSSKSKSPNIISPVSQFADHPPYHQQGQQHHQQSQSPDELMNPAARFANQVVVEEDEDEDIVSPALRHNPRRKPREQDRIQIFHDAAAMKVGSGGGGGGGGGGEYLPAPDPSLFSEPDDGMATSYLKTPTPDYDSDEDEV